jgi:hypothetical protein
VARVVGDPRHPRDHLGHPVQGPELVAEAMGARPFEQGQLDRPDLLCAQPGWAPGAAGAHQRGLSVLLPSAVPHAGGLDAHLKLSGNLGRPGSLGKERGGPAATFAEGVEVSSRPKPDRG